MRKGYIYLIENDFDDNKKALYKEMWNDIIVPTYKNYMKYHGEEQDAK